MGKICSGSWEHGKAWSGPSPWLCTGSAEAVPLSTGPKRRSRGTSRPLILVLLTLHDLDDEDFALDAERPQERLRDRPRDLPRDPDQERRRAFLCRSARSFITHSRITLGCMNLKLDANHGVMVQTQAPQAKHEWVCHRHLFATFPTKFKPCRF